jgi:hypothetical protein
MSTIKAGHEEEYRNNDVPDTTTMRESEHIQAAIAFGEEETKLSLPQLMRLYYPAALWSMALSSALIMEGMDTGLVSLKNSHWYIQLISQVNNFFAQTAYKAKFGVSVNGAAPAIPADWSVPLIIESAQD